MLQRLYDYLLKNQVIFGLFIIFLAWFLFEIRAVIFSLFLSYIIMAAVLPIVTYLRKRRVPKLLAVLIPYFTLITLVIVLIISLMPFVMQQLKSLIIGFPMYLHQSAALFGFNIDLKHSQGY